MNSDEVEAEFKWDPWDQYRSKPEELPIKEPPCKNCRYWRPVRKFTEYSDGTVNYDGVRLCQSAQMHNDFSCFSKKLRVPERSEEK